MLSPDGVFHIPPSGRRVEQKPLPTDAAAQKCTRLDRVTIAARNPALVAAGVPVVAASCLCSPAAYAGPEPDAGYKLLLLVIAAVGLVVAQAWALGYLARLNGRRFWSWSIAQLAATGTGLALFGSVLSVWLAHPEMSMLELLFTDLVFETWSSSNLLLLAAWAASSCPTIALAMRVLRVRMRPGGISGPG